MKISPKTKSVKKFNTYFDFWLSEIQFIKMWCCQRGGLRTTNYVEGWHFRLNRFLSVKKPSIVKVLDILQKELKIKTPKKREHEEMNAARKEQNNTARLVPQRRKEVRGVRKN